MPNYMPSVAENEELNKYIEQRYAKQIKEGFSPVVTFTNSNTAKAVFSFPNSQGIALFERKREDRGVNYYWYVISDWND